MKYFRTVLILTLILSGCSHEKKEIRQSEAVNSKLNFAAIKIERGGIYSKLKVPGQLAAFEEVNIFPKVNAYVKSVEVEMGDKVTKGKILMRLEAPELEQAVLASKEKYLRTRTELQLDNEHYLRLLEASKTEGAVSPFDLSTLKSKVKADSILSNTEKANWDLQKSLMDYLNVRAPFDGVITERNVHPGALVNTALKDKPMLQLKQIMRLRLQVDVPEALAAQMQIGDNVSFYTSKFPGKKNIGVISRKASDINLQLRSERIEIDIVNRDNQLTPGMYAEVELESKGNPNAFIVPKSSVVSSTESKYIIVTMEGSRKKESVITGNESIDKIEIFGNFHLGDSVIVHPTDE